MFSRRNQTFFSIPSFLYLGETIDTAALPHIINCATINGIDISTGFPLPSGNQSPGGIWTFTNGTASASPITGTIIVAGGIGISGTISATQASIWSPDQITGHTDISVADLTGITTFARSAGTNRNFVFDGDATTGTVAIQSTMPGSVAGGALTIAGGARISERLYAQSISCNAAPVASLDVMRIDEFISITIAFAEWSLPGWFQTARVFKMGNVVIVSCNSGTSSLATAAVASYAMMTGPGLPVAVIPPNDVHTCISGYNGTTVKREAYDLWVSAAGLIFVACSNALWPAGDAIELFAWSICWCL